MSRAFSRILSVTIVVALSIHLYGFLPSYLYLIEATRIPPAYFTISLLFLTLLYIVFIAARGEAVKVYNPGVLWLFIASFTAMLYYFGGSTGWLNLSSVSAGMLFSGILCVICVIIVMGTKESPVPTFSFTLKALLLIGSLAIVYDFFFPGFFVDPTSEYTNVGRGAAYYVNANNAGMAIVYGVIFIIATTKSASKYFFIAIAMFALVLTFSRSSWVAFLVVMLISTMVGAISKKAMLLTISFILLIPSFTSFALIFLLSSSRLDYESIIFGLEGSFSRFNILESMSDYSALERVSAMNSALEAISQSPFLGSGIGSTQQLYGHAPHNSFLEFWADFGIPGLLLNVFLIVIIAIRFYGENTPREKKVFCLLTSAALFVFGFFSHALISIGPQLLMVAIALSSFKLAAHRTERMSGPVCERHDVGKSGAQFSSSTQKSSAVVANSDAGRLSPTG